MRSIISAIPLLAAISTGIVLASGTGPASASGGLSCSAGEKGVTLELEGGVSRGMGGALFSFSGLATVKDASVAQDLRNTRFELEHVAQYWNDGEEMRLSLYRERDADKPHGYVQAWVKTKVVGEPDEGQYAGTFGIHVWDGNGDGEPKTFDVEGRIECFGGD
jgi:hypothetical protein